MSSECAIIHELLSGLERHSFPFEESRIPRNGIYVLFEKGESGHMSDRIVRVGTHTGESRLRPRLKQHFLLENKDRSIFRKNIGRALLSRSDNPFLADWNLDITSRKAKDLRPDLVNSEEQRGIEIEVSRFIRERFSFSVFEVNEKNERLKIESGLISSISWCEECRPSMQWLGLNSPSKKIAKSGLWLVNELYKTPLDANGIVSLKGLLSG
jgi:hypothetical protein